MGMSQPYFASDRTVSDHFVELVGEEMAEGVVCGYPWNPERKDPKLEAFRQAFRERFGTEPETYAAHAYDRMNILLWSTQVAGLNRAKLRDIMAHRTKPWPGVTGDIPFSAALDDVGEVFLARFEDGRWNYYSREDLDIPGGYIPPRDRTSRMSE
jgi:ABC-type branched-subunit amino acid transport system substrate-binding protein